MSIKTRNINSNYRIDQEVPDEADVFRPTSESGYQYSFRSWSSTYIAEEDWNQPDARDILDLEKMAEERIESQKHRITRHITAALNSVPDVKRETEAMILRLENEPHFYCPHEREESTKVHVGWWLNKHTCNPEKELTGLTSKDPYDLQRFIPKVEPTLSTSDTNVVLGKRKRVREREETACVSGSSSESRLVCDRGHRPRKARRSR